MSKNSVRINSLLNQMDKMLKDPKEMTVANFGALQREYNTLLLKEEAETNLRSTSKRELRNITARLVSEPITA